MSTISVVVSHQLEPQEAVRRIQSALAEAQQSYSDYLAQGEFRWVDQVLSYRFQTMGLVVAGTLSVGPGQVVVEAELPPTAWMLRGMIERQIHQRLSELLS
ncbi:MAG: polyhydroxyalkanoic acid system family protein [Thermoguttaceae bacterium]|nr:polyhydroxyalkanoic acid system family protein [Thermoguttaceae bacterium]MDW8036790.1 polyhydroxyalkanoic acid system family protein [Thermoguttaceae bacterium]